jgi:peptidyl-prolyl cis-trans isomerase C
MMAIARGGLIAGLIAAAGALPAAGQAVEGEVGTDVVVARVGDQEIMLSEVVGGIYAASPREREQHSFEEMYDQALQRQIDRALVYRAARASDIADDPKFLEQLRILERRALSDAYMQRELGRRVSEEAVRARYDELAAAQAGRTELRARRIRTEDEAAAQALKARLDAGEDFVEVAQELSFPGAERGGDLGYFTEDSMVPEVVAVARELEVGEVSDPVDTPYGWMLIKLEDSRPVHPRPYAERRQELYQELSHDAVRAVLDELREATPVERFKRDGTPLEEPSAPSH